MLFIYVSVWLWDYWLSLRPSVTCNNAIYPLFSVAVRTLTVPSVTRCSQSLWPDSSNKMSQKTQFKEINKWTCSPKSQNFPPGTFVLLAQKIHSWIRTDIKNMHGLSREYHPELLYSVKHQLTCMNWWVLLSILDKYFVLRIRVFRKYIVLRIMYKILISIHFSANIDYVLLLYLLIYYT